MLRRLISVVLALTIATLLTNCQSTQSLPPRPLHPEGIPDLTKGQMPSAKDAKADWFLHCGRTRGWAFRNEAGKCDDARQILVTEVPFDSPVRYELKEGDVILGVNGKYFSKMPIYEFREASAPAKRVGGQFEVTLWRKGWDTERRVLLDLSYKPVDFTKGDNAGRNVDWNLGPTGARGYFASRNHQSAVARQILISRVEKGSPADGILQKNDVILGVEGRAFSYDARRAFGEAITRAETHAGNGQLSVRRWRGGIAEDVIIPIKVMGAYSPKTPWNCVKTENILKDACEYLIEKDILNKKYAVQKVLAALALMATGDPEHMKIAKTYVYDIAERAEKEKSYPPCWGYAAWGWAYHNIMLSEYYLITGDKKVLPAIRIFSERLAEGQSGVGSWGHRMAAPGHGRCFGYGAMNQASLACWISLLMAKRCGVKSDEIERAIIEGKGYLANFIDRQIVPYGDNIIFDGNRHDDNGKTSAAAIGFSLADDKEGTAYFGTMTIASWRDREHGHTGNLWSFLWGPLGAARVGQEACTAFLKKQTWLFDLERRWDGGFTYQGKMGWGYGVDEKTGKQKKGPEHMYRHWDTTACRILMYTLPRKRLLLTGKGSLVAPTLIKDVDQILNAGELPEKDTLHVTQRYDNKSREELLKLLESWSPISRGHAATSLAKRKGDDTADLLALLNSPNRYAQYGACAALRKHGARSSAAVGELIKRLSADDIVLRSYAIMALGAIGGKEATEALLKLAASEIPEVKHDYLHRIIGRALFERGGALAESIDGVDRELLIPAAKRMMCCAGGTARDQVAKGVLKKLTYDELSSLWPDMLTGMKSVGLTEICSGAKARMAIAETLAKYKVKEGMPLLLSYVRKQNMYGSKDRNQKIMDYLVSYGTHAKPMLPAMKEYVEYCEKDHPWVDHSRPGIDCFLKGQVPFVKAAIDAIEDSNETPELRTIEPYLK